MVLYAYFRGILGHLVSSKSSGYPKKKRNDLVNDEKMAGACIWTDPKGDYIWVGNLLPRLDVVHALVCGGSKVVNTSEKTLVAVSTIHRRVARGDAHEDGALGAGIRALRVQRHHILVMSHFEWRHQCWGYCTWRTHRLLVFSHMTVQLWSHKDSMERHLC